MMVDHTHRSDRQMIDRAEYLHRWNERQPSERVRVWLASYVGEAVAIAPTYGLDVNMDSDPDPGRGQRDVWGATIKVGSGGCQLCGTAVPSLFEVLKVRGPGIRQIWPSQRQLTWTPAPGFDTPGLIRLADGISNRIKTLSEPPRQP
jgi:hypothetical protein